MSHDYDLRGPDWDTSLCGPITEAIIDADRLTLLDFKPRIPAFYLYRAAYCGDSLYVPFLKRWAIGFVDCALAGRVKRTERDELVGLIALDVIFQILELREMVTPAEAEDLIGVPAKAYKRLRACILQMVDGELREYFGWLGAAYRATILTNRRAA